MLVSIIHRATIIGLSTLGVVVLVWWLTAAASSAEAYASFTDHADNWYGIVIGIALSWLLFQFMLAGLRHLLLDIGAGFELSTNKFWSNMTMAGAIVLTALFWAYILGVR